MNAQGCVIPASRHVCNRPDQRGLGLGVKVDEPRPGAGDQWSTQARRSRANADVQGV